MCAYVTGPHRLAPLLWRTARVAPRPPRRANLPHNPAQATSTFAVHPSQGANLARNSHSAAFWETACQRDNPSSDRHNQHNESSDSRRGTRDDELYHSGSAAGRERVTCDGPFSLSSEHPSPHGLGRLDTLSTHEGHALRRAGRNSPSAVAGGVSPVASDHGLVFWDAQTAQQMYLRYQEPETTRESGSFSGFGTTRGYTITPDSRDDLQSISASACAPVSGELGTSLCSCPDRLLYLIVNSNKIPYSTLQVGVRAGVA